MHSAPAQATFTDANTLVLANVSSTAQYYGKGEPWLFAVEAVAALVPSKLHLQIQAGMVNEDQCAVTGQLQSCSC